MTNARLASVVRGRALHRCEYCLLPQAAREFRFHIDHILPRQHGGTDSLENFALACGRCNRRKGPNLTGIDPTTGLIERLFDPRLQSWEEHFAISSFEIVGTTGVGRATASTLHFNEPIELATRAELQSSGGWPPDVGGLQ